MSGYTEGFGPVSSNLSHALLLPRTEIHPGDTLVILGYWIDGEIPFIAVGDPISEDSNVEYSIRLIAESEPDVFLVLQVSPEWWDPEEEEPPQAVVRVVAGVIIQCLYEHEAESLIPVLQSTWHNRTHLPAFEQKQLLVSEAEELFSQFFQSDTDTEVSGALRDTQENLTSEIDNFFADLLETIEVQDREIAASELSQDTEEIVQQQTPELLNYPDGTIRNFEFDDGGLRKVINPDGSILHRAKNGAWIEIDADGEMTGQVFEPAAVSVDNFGNFTLHKPDGRIVHHWADGTKLETGLDEDEEDASQSVR